MKTPYRDITKQYATKDQAGRWTIRDMNELLARYEAHEQKSRRSPPRPAELFSDDVPEPLDPQK